jgi:hypothetical protein
MNFFKLIQNLIIAVIITNHKRGNHLMAVQTRLAPKFYELSVLLELPCGLIGVTLQPSRVSAARRFGSTGVGKILHFLCHGTNIELRGQIPA